VHWEKKWPLHWEVLFEENKELRKEPGRPTSASPGTSLEKCKLPLELLGHCLAKGPSCSPSGAARKFSQKKQMHCLSSASSISEVPGSVNFLSCYQ
jgi:hypothetical protein